jgi:hypothetical protein
MLEQPLADGAVHADVVADLLGLEPLVVCSEPSVTSSQ